MTVHPISARGAAAARVASFERGPRARHLDPPFRANREAARRSRPAGSQSARVQNNRRNTHTIGTATAASDAAASTAAKLHQKA